MSHGVSFSASEPSEISGEDVVSHYGSSAACRIPNLAVVKDYSFDINSLHPSSTRQTESTNPNTGGCRSPVELQAITVLRYLPESLGQVFGALTDLDLSYYTHLRKIPESFGQLKVLASLRILECPNLVTLPESVGQLLALGKLKVSRCYSFRTLPESIGQLQALTRLTLKDVSIEGIPASLGQLKSLTHLHLDCGSLVKLPESLGQLKALKIINLSCCHKLKNLPESLGQLEALKVLDLSFCYELTNLPESLGQLQALTILDLSYTHLVTLPESISQLHALTYLDFNRTRHSFGVLGQLPLVHWGDTDRMDELQLQVLTHVDLGFCSNFPALVTLPNSLGQLPLLHRCKAQPLKQLHPPNRMDVSFLTNLITLPNSSDQIPLVHWCRAGCFPGFYTSPFYSSHWHSGLYTSPPFTTGWYTSLPKKYARHREYLLKGSQKWRGYSTPCEQNKVQGETLRLTLDDSSVGRWSARRLASS